MPLRKLLRKITCRSNLDDTGKQNFFACFITAFQIRCLIEAKESNALLPSFLEGGRASSTSNLSKYVYRPCFHLQILINKEMLFY